MNSWRNWVHGLIGAFIGGGANAVSVMVIAPETFNIHAGLEKLGGAFLLSGIISAALYLKQSPLPQDTAAPHAV